MNNEFLTLSNGTVINVAAVVSDTPDPNIDNNNDTSIVTVEPNNQTPGTPSETPEIPGETPITPVSKAPAKMHAAGNPLVMVLLALFAIVCVTLRRKN